MAFRLDVPDTEDPIALADWVETMMLRRNFFELSRSALTETLAAELAAQQQELQIPVGFLLKEMGRRRRVAGNGYPFYVEDSVIRYLPTESSAFYIFLLLVSLDGPMRRGRKFQDIDQTFDKIVSEAVRSYLGPGTQTLRFGWPPSDGRPASFSKALDWLAERIGLPVGPGKPSRGTKDGGLDVIAWKPFNDKRAAFALALVQCTVQTDWHPKSKDILDDVWRGRIDSGRALLSSLAVPFVIPRDYDKWDDLRRMTDLVFDRLRLAQVLANSKSASFGEMTTWIQKEISSLTF